MLLFLGPSFSLYLLYHSNEGSPLLRLSSQVSVYVVLIAKANKQTFRSFAREPRHSGALTEAQFMQPQLLGSKFF